MHIGVLEIELFLHHPQSLKEKRGIVKRIIERTRNQFNISIAETGHLDLYQRSVIGISVVSSDQKVANSVLNHVVAFIENLYLADIINVKMEFY